MECRLFWRDLRSENSVITRFPHENLLSEREDGNGFDRAKTDYIWATIA